MLLGIIGNVAYQLCFIYALDWTRAGNASLILATTPVWTVLLSAAMGHERMSPRVFGGVVATLCGMALVVLGRGDEVAIDSSSVRGDLLMMAASMLWSVYTVAGRRPLARYGPLRVTTWTLWVGTPFLVLMASPGLSTLDVGRVSPGAWAGVTYAGLLSIGLAYLIWYRGVEKLGNSRTAVYSNLVPVWALLSAWLWLGEVPAALQLVGAGVVLGGLMVARTGRAAPGDRVSGATPARPAPALPRDS